MDSAARREAFVDAVRSSLLASVSSPLPVDNAIIIFLGLRFPPRYVGLHPEHCLYGSLRRLNEKVGDGHCHWFMEGHHGSDVDGTLMEVVGANAKENDAPRAAHVVSLWRTGLAPPADELSSLLDEHSVTDVTVVGAKASQAVQAAVQFVADRHPGVDLSVVREALADDGEGRLDAVVRHLLPLYSRVASLEEYVEATCGAERFAEAMAAGAADGLARAPKDVRYLSNCQRGGHFSIYAHHLTHRKAPPRVWMEHPTQKWYEDVFQGRQYHCPLGKRVVAFCDEPSFSEISMFIKGRDCLDDKAKLSALAPEYLPETYVVKGGLDGWEGAESRPSQQDRGGPWFVKETDKNGGRSIRTCANASECIALATDPRETYVVQCHVPDPHLTNDDSGRRKWLLKLYSLLVCKPAGPEESADGAERPPWTLRCHDEAFLCAASEEWSRENLSPEAQLTIERTRRFRNGHAMGEFDSDGDVYPNMFRRCSEAVASIVGRAIESEGLQRRPGKKQFEIFSTDFMFDATLEKLYIIEFNFSPVLFDPHANQELTTPGLWKYNTLFQHFGDEAEVNDHDMIEDAVTIVFFPKEASKKVGVNGNIGGWQVIQSFEAKPTLS